MCCCSTVDTDMSEMAVLKCCVYLIVIMMCCCSTVDIDMSEMTMLKCGIYLIVIMMCCCSTVDIDMSEMTVLKCCVYLIVIMMCCCSTVDIDMSEMTVLKCRMLGGDHEHSLCTDDYASLVLQRSVSFTTLDVLFRPVDAATGFPSLIHFFLLNTFLM